MHREGHLSLPLHMSELSCSQASLESRANNIRRTSLQVIPVFSTRHRACSPGMTMSSIPTIQTRATEVSRTPSMKDRLFRQTPGDLKPAEAWLPSARPAIDFPLGAFEQLLRGIRKRWRRERRRRKVGRAYDMAQEIARAIPKGARVLDVGCGNGYIAHHLSAMLKGAVVGIDLVATTEAPIDYRPFNGLHFPVEDESFDAILLCYVLHHTQNLEVVMHELRRVMKDGGRAVIYEDIPETWWDSLICWIHDRKWRNRTGPCTFHSGREWRTLFKSASFEILDDRRLSRWRNLAHPVARRLTVLRAVK